MDAYTLILILQFSQLQAPTATVRKPYVNQAEYYSMACERAEWNKPWKEPKVLKGNSTSDRLRHDPE